MNNQMGWLYMQIRILMLDITLREWVFAGMDFCGIYFCRFTPNLQKFDKNHQFTIKFSRKNLLTGVIRVYFR